MIQKLSKDGIDLLLNANYYIEKRPKCSEYQIDTYTHYMFIDGFGVFTLLTTTNEFNVGIVRCFAEILVRKEMLYKVFGQRE